MGKKRRRKAKAVPGERNRLVERGVHETLGQSMSKAFVRVPVYPFPCGNCQGIGISRLYVERLAVRPAPCPRLGSRFAPAVPPLDRVVWRPLLYGAAGAEGVVCRFDRTIARRVPNV